MVDRKKYNQKTKEATEKKEEEKKVSIFDKMKKVVTKAVDCCKE